MMVPGLLPTPCILTKYNRIKSVIYPECSTSIQVGQVHLSLRPRQNGRLFADDTFKHIFLNENIRISIKISLKFVANGLINNIPALVLIMAWRRPGDKPLSDPMMVRSLTHICVTRPQWVNSLRPGDMHTPIQQGIESSLLQVLTPIRYLDISPEQMLTYCQMDFHEQSFMTEIRIETPNTCLQRARSKMSIKCWSLCSDLQCIALFLECFGDIGRRSYTIWFTITPYVDGQRKFDVDSEAFHLIQQCTRE